MTIGIIQPMNLKNGILLINKPLNMSSHDVVNVLRKAFKTRTVGHAGTLDVEASGVLVCGINQGTKLLRVLQNHDKTYVFDVLFNQTTDTLDHTGVITETKDVKLPEWLDLTSFIGLYLQDPPAYSAVKVGGKKLYEYARKNQEIPEVPPREITVKAFEQLSPIKENKSSFKVTASSGLYVRKLALDLAEQYGSIAHTTKITRIKVGDFEIHEAVSLESFKPDDVLSLSDSLRHLKAHELSSFQAREVSFGKPLKIDSNEEALKCVKDEELYAIYIKKNDQYVAKRVFKGV